MFSFIAASNSKTLFNYRLSSLKGHTKSFWLNFHQPQSLNSLISSSPSFSSSCRSLTTGHPSLRSLNPKSCTNYHPCLNSLSGSSSHILTRSIYPSSPSSISIRSISFLPFLKPLRRLPLLLAGSLVSVFAYVQYKLSASTQWLSDHVQLAKSKLTESIDSFSNTLQPLQSYFEQRLRLFTNSPLSPQKDSSNSKLHAESPTSETHPIISLPSTDTTGSTSTSSSSTTSPTSQSKNEALLDLTKQLIQLRSMLNNVHVSGDLVLPSIVVIGSQSSGKTSLLETLVGQSFLPKGKNMVTRRPLELTLIHTQEAESPYADLPQLGLKGLKDFKHLQQTLLDLNLALKDQCISDEPIQLTIYASHLPNLSLVDLPGYIQIHAQHQPESLKESISRLCDKYIQAPNIILAVCAADVDLANAEALRAARKADPLGERTIGVLTKMDLVDSASKQQLLQVTKKDYPLSLGYVGISNQKETLSTPSTSTSSSNLFNPFGLTYLKKLLVQTLEYHMTQRLAIVMEAVKKELNELNYQYKVLYNDRSLTPETYIAETFDLFKQKFRDLENEYGKQEVHRTVMEFLNQKIANLCSSIYWYPSDSSSSLPSPSSPYTPTQLNSACSALTKSGIGLSTTQLIVSHIDTYLSQVLQKEPFLHHPTLQSTFSGLFHRLLEKQFRVTVEQVENALKPLKFENQCTLNEWKDSVAPAIELIDKEMQNTKDSMTQLQRQLGRRHLRRALAHLKRSSVSNTTTSAAGETSTLESNLPPEVISQAQKVMDMNQKLTVLQTRRKQLQSKTCRQPSPECPEIMLMAIAHQLARTASMFIFIELLHEFYFQFPRELDTLFLYNYTKDQIHALAKEHPEIEKQLTLFHRKSVLETAAAHLSLLMKEKNNRRT